MSIVLKKVSEEKIKLFESDVARKGIVFTQVIKEAIDNLLKLSESMLTEDRVIDYSIDEKKLELIKRYRGKYVVIAYSETKITPETIRNLTRVIDDFDQEFKGPIVIHLGIDEERWGKEWWCKNSTYVINYSNYNYGL